MSSLPHSTPAAAGVDSRGVHRFLDAAAAAGLQLHGLTVLRDGRIVADGSWAPYRSDGLNLLYSVSKSLTSAALGRAVLQGTVGLDDRALDHLPEVVPGNDRLGAITVRQLASMTTGRDGDGIDDVLARVDAGTPLMQACFDGPSVAAPGERFGYDNAATLTLGGVLRAAAGTSLVELLTPAVLEPLGIHRLAWRTVSGSDEEAWSGLHLRTRDIAAFGQLMLQGGVWHGERLLSEEWFDAATSVQVETPDEGPADWCRGYGLQFWQSRHGFRADGAFGQYVLVLPEQNAVVAVTSELIEQGQQLLDLVWEHLVPSFGAEADSAADAQLAERMSSLTLEPLGDRAPGPATLSGKAAEPPADAPPIARAALGAGRRGRILTLVFSDGQEASIPVGDGEWPTGAVDVPGVAPLEVAASGGWRDDGAFEAELRFVSTPHSIRLVLDAHGGLTATWRAVPLYGADPRTLAVAETRIDG